MQLPRMSTRLMMVSLLFALLLVCNWIGDSTSSHAWRLTPRGLVVDVVGTDQVETSTTFRVVAEVGSLTSFRLGIDFSTNSDSPTIDSPSLDTDRGFANFTRTTKKVDGVVWVGINTDFGTILVDAATGNWRLEDVSGKTIATSKAPPTLRMTDESGVAEITMAVSGSKTGPGATGRRACLVNGAYDPMYTWDMVDKYFSFVVTTWQYDSEFMHCYPASFDGPDHPVHQADSCTTITHQLPVPESTMIKTIQANDGHDTCCDACNDEPTCTAWVYNSTAMNCKLYACVGDAVQTSDHAILFGGILGQCPPPMAPPKTSHQQGWWARGNRVDYYLSPTPLGGYDFTKALYHLTGPIAIPPKFGMGFMATYWGYKSMQQVETNMSKFRQEKMPIDSFIMDYDWFGPDPCGATKTEQGGISCGDYGYRGSFWVNQSFPQLDGTVVHTKTPRDVLNHFHAEPLHMRFAGIRKPRTYSNFNLSQKKDWLLPNNSDVGEGGDINWNFTSTSLRQWYTDTHKHFIEDGIDFWWNDEGETEWFTYLYWNMAQEAQFTSARPNKRFFTVNRAFQPGMQRFPATSWTGDGQDCSHNQLIRSVLSGQPYTSCDLTSPDPTTLVRQYQSAVFNPIMRVHQMGGTPRFPWFWGGAEHQTAFREALEMRYRLLPFFYSLAHRAYVSGRPLGVPASWEFPDDASVEASATYIVGGVIIPATLGLAHTSSTPPRSENTSSTYLPQGEVADGDCTWFQWNTTTTSACGQTITHRSLRLNEMVIHVRAGTVLPLQSDTIQHTDQAGGLLLVQVYAGRDGEFTMVEDDGESLDYKTKGYDESVRLTKWSWSDTFNTLKWSTLLQPTITSSYLTVQAVLFTANSTTKHTQPRFSTIRPLSSSGEFRF